MNTTSVCVFISNLFGSGASAPVTAEAISLPSASTEVNSHSPTLAEVIAAHQALRAACERTVNDLQGIAVPAVTQPTPPDPASNPINL